MYPQTAIVICSRVDSSRVPNKPFKMINGKTLIEHLIDRCRQVGVAVIVAVPFDQAKHYHTLSKIPGVIIHSSFYVNDPLRRTNEVSVKYGLNTIVRITHDKIFIDPELIKESLNRFFDNRLDYMFGSRLIPGSGFEIISSAPLGKAAIKYENVEFIGYAVKQFANKIEEIENGFHERHHANFRLLIDYPEDVTLMNVVMTTLGNDVSLFDVIKYLSTNKIIASINKLPDVTVYTCAFNAKKYIVDCMNSVKKQAHTNFEYIIIDDFSHDGTTEIIASFCKLFGHSWHRNDANVGLASSSNVALSKARGKYIVRLDADDFFLQDTSLSSLHESIDRSHYDIVYPANSFGGTRTQKGDERFHVGGAIFRRNALNYIKFKDGLRHYEGLELFSRARSQLKYGVLDKEIFFYRQHDQSMSKNDLKEREAIKNRILNA